MSNSLSPVLLPRTVSQLHLNSMTRSDTTSSLKGSIQSGSVSGPRGRALTQIQEWRGNMLKRLQGERARLHLELLVPHHPLLGGLHRPAPQRTARRASPGRNGSVSLNVQGSMCAPTVAGPALSLVSSRNTSAHTQGRDPTPVDPAASPSRPRVIFISIESLIPTR